MNLKGGKPRRHSDLDNSHGRREAKTARESRESLVGLWGWRPGRGGRRGDLEGPGTAENLNFSLPDSEPGPGAAAALSLQSESPPLLDMSC